jgi:MFS family permease
MWAASAAIGAAIGPLLGGALAELGGWGGVFWVSAIGMLACVPLVLRFVPESRAAEQAGARFDWWGVALLAIAMSMLILYATYAADIGWLSLAGVGVLVAMVASTIAFLAVERRVDAPLVDLGLLRNQPFVVATLALVVFNCTFTAFVLGLQLYLQQPFGPGMSALQSGAALLPAVVVMLVASALVTRVSTRIGVHTTIVAGFVLLGAGLLAAAPLDASWTIAWFLPCLVLVGIGGALANGPVTAVATGSVDADQAGSAAGVNNMARYLGTAIAAPIATGIYMGVATSRTTDTLEGLGATDAADRSEQLVGASGSGALDALQRLPDATADAVHDGVGAAISAGMATLSVVLAAMCVIPVLLFVLPGRRRAADPEPGFDSATAPAAHAHTIPRLRRFGARARAGRGRG